VRGGDASGRPTAIDVSVQVKDPGVDSDLAWSTAAGFTVDRLPPGPHPPQDDFILWSGSVRQQGADELDAGEHRLLIQEYELYEADDENAHGVQLGRRLVYAETVPLDDALLRPPPFAAATTAV
jgi:hypothetical protein